MNANAEEQVTQALRWAGKGPVSETRVIELDCGDAQYVLSITNKHRERPKLTKFERAPAQFSVDVKQKIESLVSEFFTIEKFALSCGAGPADYASHQNEVPSPFKDFPEQDFTGQLQVHIVGFHSADTKKAEKKCEEQQGKFEFETWRFVTLSIDQIEIRPNNIGRCIDWSSDWKRDSD
ncbi:hypothetical protein [Hyphococcus sp.]|uniref:hypothetical protein n=1 Tax=Hyphococcus sp. TaxID=2038636 RepID=UPI002086188C|nr:MAG: hypothetical protein DHS20C04_21370 [Marinicaulis sp.]